MRSCVELPWKVAVTRSLWGGRFREVPMKRQYWGVADEFRMVYSILCVLSECFEAGEQENRKPQRSYRNEPTIMSLSISVY